MSKVAKVEVKKCSQCPNFRCEDGKNGYCTILYSRIPGAVISGMIMIMDTCPLPDAIFDVEGNIV